MHGGYAACLCVLSERLGRELLRCRDGGDASLSLPRARLAQTRAGGGGGSGEAGWGAVCRGGCCGED